MANLPFVTLDHNRGLNCDQLANIYSAIVQQVCCRCFLKEAVIGLRLMTPNRGSGLDFSHLIPNILTIGQIYLWGSHQNETWCGTCPYHDFICLSSPKIAAKSDFSSDDEVRRFHRYLPVFQEARGNDGEIIVHNNQELNQHLNPVSRGAEVCYSTSVRRNPPDLSTEKAQTNATYF